MRPASPTPSSILSASSLAAAVVTIFLHGTPASAAQEVPESHIPGAVLLELRNVERQFDAALAQDCAAERCQSKGCGYTSHVTVDVPSGSSLPGLAAEQGPGSVPPQDYLTGVRCEFAHEKTVSSRDVQALARRLEQRLSRGFLKVSVDPQQLEPVAKSLREPTEADETPPPAPTAAAPEPVKVEEPPWTLELWRTLLPHSPWMMAIALLTLSVLVLIWGGRRLGSESIEEKMLAAQLAAQAGANGDAAPTNAPAAATKDDDDDDAETTEDPESAFAEEQERAWSDRIEREEREARGDADTLFKGILRQWLRAGELPLLARAVQLFGDRISLAFAADADTAMRKVELAEYLRTVDEEALPSRADFFRRLNQHAIAAALLAQSDVELYRSLREELGAQGLLQLMESLPPRYGALAFALSSPERQHDTVHLMAEPLRGAVAEELLSSSRVAPEELAHFLRVLEAARAGKALPAPPARIGIGDRGIELDAAGALSILLPAISNEVRGTLFTRALARSSGVAPRWYEGIFFGDMLSRLPAEVRKELVLEVDVRGLAAWTSLQPLSWQLPFLADLSPSLQDALRGNMSFESRGEQLRQGKRGHTELVAALQRRFVKGRLSFAELVGA